MEPTFLPAEVSFLHKITLAQLYLYNVFVNSFDITYFFYFKIFFVSVIAIVTCAVLASYPRFKSYHRTFQITARISYIFPITFFISMVMMCCVTFIIDSSLKCMSFDWFFLLNSFKTWGIVVIFVFYYVIVKEFFPHFSCTRASLLLCFCIVSFVNVTILYYEGIAMFSIISLFSWLLLFISIFSMVEHTHKVVTYKKIYPPIIKFSTSKINYGNLINKQQANVINL